VDRFGILKKLAWMPLAIALLQGCTSVSGSGATLAGWGFASDTTAILFYELWESYKTFLDISPPPATSYYGWELKLVDVRFNKVYWSAKVDHNRSNSQILTADQWNDSTMLIELTGEGYWLWTVGNKKTRKINFNWNVERKNYEAGVLLYDFRLRPWKEDSVLLYSKTRQAIIDSKTMTVNDWSPIGDDAWVSNCDDFWWVSNGGICLRDTSFHNCRDFGWIKYGSGGICLFDETAYAVLLSEKGDTLGNFTNTGKKFNHDDTYFYLDNQSSYWIFGKRNFIDSLRNVMEH